MRDKRAAAERLGAGGAEPFGMPGNLLDPDCPTRLVLDRVGDKWTALVVLLLSDGPLRFSELRGLERDGLVDREIFAEVPPRVQYSLTDLGRSLVEPISIISDWAEVHVSRITAAQDAYDAKHAQRQARQ